MAPELQATVDAQNHLGAVDFTPANHHDNQSIRRLVNKQTRIIVGDSHYGGAVSRRYLWRDWGVLVVAPPHHSQTDKLLAGWQPKLLRLRPKVEAVSGLLKERLSLMTHYPRSQAGYPARYLRCLPGYQVEVIS